MERGGAGGGRGGGGGGGRGRRGGDGGGRGRQGDWRGGRRGGYSGGVSAQEPHWRPSRPTESQWHPTSNYPVSEPGSGSAWVGSGDGTSRGTYTRGGFPRGQGDRGRGRGRERTEVGGPSNLGPSQPEEFWRPRPQPGTKI